MHNPYSSWWSHARPMVPPPLSVPGERLRNVKDFFKGKVIIPLNKMKPRPQERSHCLPDRRQDPSRPQRTLGCRSSRKPWKKFVWMPSDFSQSDRLKISIGCATDDLQVKKPGKTQLTHLTTLSPGRIWFAPIGKDLILVLDVLIFMVILVVKPRMQRKSDLL